MFSLWFCHDATMAFVCLFVDVAPIVCWCFMFNLWFCHDATIVFVCLLLLPLCVGVSCLVSGFVMMRQWCLLLLPLCVCASC